MLSSALLRLAVIEALCPASAQAVSDGFPTLAGMRVFDSEPVPRAQDDPDGDLASITVNTDLVLLTQQSEDSQSDWVMRGTVILDCDVTQIDGETATENLSPSSSQTEVLLDLLTAQAWRALTVGPTGALFRTIWREWGQCDIQNFRVPELSLRLARKTMHLQVHCHADDWSESPPVAFAAALAALPPGDAKTLLTGLSSRIDDNPSLTPLNQILITWGDQTINALD